MARLTVEFPEDVRRLAEARAVEAGCADVGEYLARLVRDDAAGAPPNLTIDSDDQLEALLRRRADDSAVEMDAADFAQMREKLRARLRGTNHGQSK